MAIFNSYVCLPEGNIAEQQNRIDQILLVQASGFPLKTQSSSQTQMFIVHDVGTEQENTILCQKLNVPIYTWIC
jgi:hypothetical protein